MRTWSVLAATPGVLVGLVFIAAAAGAAQPAQVRDRDPSWLAPEDTASKTNPLAGRPQTASGGRKIFRQRCATCHDVDAHGTDRGPDLLAADVQAQSDGALFWKISSGNTRAGMPSFSFLPDLQRWQVVLYLRSLAGDGRSREGRGCRLTSSVRNLPNHHHGRQPMTPSLIGPPRPDRSG